MISVTRFGEILPLGQFLSVYLVCDKNFEHTLAKIMGNFSLLSMAKYFLIIEPPGANYIKLYRSVNYGFVVTAKL